MPRTRVLSLADVLDAEVAEAEQTGLNLCLAPHHTDPDIVCQRLASHTTDGTRSREQHAAKRVWHGGQPETWATWA